MNRSRPTAGDPFGSGHKPFLDQRQALGRLWGGAARLALRSSVGNREPAHQTAHNARWHPRQFAEPLAEVRLLRDNVVIYQGKISSLKRFKDDASEVARGYECGIGIQNFNDVKVGDVIEAFVTEKVMADVGA